VLRVVVAAVLAVGLLVWLAGSQARPDAGGNPSGVTAGDRLVYDVTTELQAHHVRVHGGRPVDKVSASSAQGSEVFSIASISPDGTAIGVVRLDLSGDNAGQPVAVSTAAPAKILPDGRLQVGVQPGLGVSDAIAFANSSVSALLAHTPLAVGQQWTTTSHQDSAVLSLTRRVIGQTRYHGLAVYEVAVTGSGVLLPGAAGKDQTGSVTLSGVTYYAPAERILVGQVIRALTVVKPATGGSDVHDDYSAGLNLVLRTWTHASPAPAAEEGSSATPELSPTPEPVQTPYGMEPAATQTIPPAVP
jgi:hypothetical protein